MDKLYRVFLIAMAATIAGFIMVAIMNASRCALPEAASVGKRCGNPFSNVLYDFQTLIAGLLAIAAAVMTIIQTKKISDRQIRSQNYVSIAEINTAAMTLSFVGRETADFCRIFSETDETQTASVTRRIYLRVVVRNMRQFVSEYHHLRERGHDRHFDERIRRGIDRILLFDKTWLVDPLDEKGGPYDIDSAEWIDNSEPSRHKLSVDLLKTYLDIFLPDLKKWEADKKRDLE